VVSRGSPSRPTALRSFDHGERDEHGGVAVRPLERVHSAVMPIVAGVRLTREDALALSSMLTAAGSDHAARLVLRAVTEGQEFVALTRDDKEDALAALTRRPAVLVGLRRALFDELNWQRQGLAPPRRAHGIAAVTNRRSRERVNIAWV
jgi:hypothetical protein